MFCGLGYLLVFLISYTLSSPAYPLYPKVLTNCYKITKVTIFESYELSTVMVVFLQHEYFFFERCFACSIKQIIAKT